MNSPETESDRDSSYIFEDSNPLKNAQFAHASHEPLIQTFLSSIQQLTTFATRESKWLSATENHNGYS